MCSGHSAGRGESRSDRGQGWLLGCGQSRVAAKAAPTRKGGVACRAPVGVAAKAVPAGKGALVPWHALGPCLKSLRKNQGQAHSVEKGSSHAPVHPADLRNHPLPPVGAPFAAPPSPLGTNSPPPVGASFAATSSFAPAPRAPHLSERLQPRPLAPPVAWAPMVRLAGLAPTFLLTAPSRHKFGTALAPAKKGSAKPAMIRPEAGERGGGG